MTYNWTELFEWSLGGLQLCYCVCLLLYFCWALTHSTGECIRQNTKKLKRETEPPDLKGRINELRKVNKVNAVSFAFVVCLSGFLRALYLSIGHKKRKIWSSVSDDDESRVIELLSHSRSISSSWECGLNKMWIKTCSQPTKWVMKGGNYSLVSRHKYLSLNRWSMANQKVKQNSINWSDFHLR